MLWPRGRARSIRLRGGGGGGVLAVLLLLHHPSRLRLVLLVTAAARAVILILTLIWRRGIARQAGSRLVGRLRMRGLCLLREGSRREEVVIILRRKSLGEVLRGWKARGRRIAIYARCGVVSGRRLGLAPFWRDCWR